MSMVVSRVLFLFYAFLISTIPAVAQILHPANWNHKFSEEEVNIGDQVELIFEATIDPKWYLYSSDFDPELGPKVTEFNFIPHASYELIGGIRAINPSEGYDEIFEGNYTYFKGKGEFRQTVRILGKNPSISGNYDYQVCSDIDGKCIPFDEEFTFQGLKVLASVSRDSAGSMESLPPLPFDEPVTEPAEVNGGGIDTAGTSSIQRSSIWTQKSPNTPYSLLTFLLGAFFAGFLALLTPCVYPMIPMTVTYFTNSSNNRRRGIFHAIFYGFCIIVIFTLLGTLVAVLGGPEFANWVATHWLPNMIFFVMFVFFALWFLGLFEINLPSSLVNNVDRKSDSGGLLGVFFMALTLVLVSFSCTGPFVGSILIASSSGHVLMPVLGMLGFSAAFALTFGAFAIFPEWLKSMPRSGSWLNTVKVFLGFIELALSLKFLSMVDQVYHWGILDRDVFIAIWVAIMLVLTAYLLAIIKLPGDESGRSISIPRLLTAMGVLGFTVYLIPGLWGAPLKPLSGYLPPLTSQDFRAQKYANPLSSENSICDEPLYGDLLKLPHGLKGYFDLDQAIECARERNKPIFIDFTGHGCVNCREMEAVVWSDPEVLQRLNNDFIVVALYVDEKKELPESQWYTSEYDQKVKKTMGKQNADLQIRWYGNNAQPFYVLLDPNNPQQPLVKPVAYNKSIPHFIDFLDAGLAVYQNNSVP
ncbi:MAG: thiol:disulfide interchange protein DsbD [Cyclobacteriaceae bacterium]|nr:MAG: thiol:disulfide interchange protein DsbD [Cyclobacteriaceae bacterium]